MADEKDILQTKGLDDLLKMLKASRPPKGKIGILSNGARNSKKGAPESNASIGAVHEFGSPARGIPQRSFLRIPLMQNLQKELESSGLLTNKTGDDAIKTGSLRPWLEKIALCAEAVIQEAFDTGGNGKWPSWKGTNKHHGESLLVDTGQLKRSISAEITSG